MLVIKRLKSSQGCNAQSLSANTIVGIPVLLIRCLGNGPPWMPPFAEMRDMTLWCAQEQNAASNLGLAMMTKQDFMFLEMCMQVAGSIGRGRQQQQESQRLPRSAATLCLAGTDLRPGLQPC